MSGPPKAKGVQYAKGAKAGDVVHAKATDLHSDAQTKRWFGNKYKGSCLTGIVQSVESVDRKRWLTVEWEMPDSSKAIKPIRDLRCKPGPWTASAAAPDIPLLGLTVPTIVPTSTSTLASPNCFDDPRFDDADDDISALGTSQDTDGSDLIMPGQPSPPSPPTPPPTPVVVTDNIAWFTEMDVEEDVNGPVPGISWFFRGGDGKPMKEGDDTDEDRTLLDYFMAVFPPRALRRIIKETNYKLLAEKANTIDVGDILKFFGVMILVSRFEFGRRRDLWKLFSDSPYIPAQMIGETTGMSRNRFEEIWSCLTFSKVPDERPAGMSSAAYRWKHVDDFVDDFNRHRRNNFSPSEVICIDESMSRWYGIGGDWINDGVPHYMAIDRKVRRGRGRYVAAACLTIITHMPSLYSLLQPENGCEIQNAACGVTGIMMTLHIVKGAEEVLEVDDDDRRMLHGCQVMLHLLRHWRSAKERIVCADSYFASVPAALRLYEYGFRFIGVVKTATKGYPKDYLGSVMMPVRGTVAALTATVDDTTLLGLVYCDRDRRYFISTCSNAGSGDPVRRLRLQQVRPVESNEDPERVSITMNQPRVAQIYYSACGTIDQHNRGRQSTLNLEKKMQTKCWHKRVNTSILGMIIIDAFRLHSMCTGAKMTQQEFTRGLIRELVENKFAFGVTTRPSTASRVSVDVASLASTTGSAGRGLHITPTKRVFDDGGSGPKKFRQSRCKLCDSKTVYVCSECRLDPSCGEVGAAYCNPLSSRMCFRTHMEQSH